MLASVFVGVRRTKTMQDILWQHQNLELTSPNDVNSVELYRITKTIIYQFRQVFIENQSLMVRYRLVSNTEINFTSTNKRELRMRRRMSKCKRTRQLWMEKAENRIHDKLMHVYCIYMKIKAKQYISSIFFNSHTKFYAEEEKTNTYIYTYIIMI